MGLFSDLWTGGDQKVKTELPDYVEKPSKQIGYGVDYTLAQQRKNPNGLSATQQAGMDRLLAQAYAGSGLGMLPTQVLQQAVGQGGLDPRTAQFGEGVLSGAMNNPMRDEAARVAYGGDVGKNPYLQDTYNRAARGLAEQYQNTVSPGMTSQAAARGRLGSGAYARMRGQAEQGLATGLGDLANQVYGGAYENDRARQMQALGLSGQLAQQDTANQFNAANLFSTGLDRTLNAIQLTPQAMAAQYADADRLLQLGNTQNDLQFRPFQTAQQALQGLNFGQTQINHQNSNPITGGIQFGAGLASMFMPGAGGGGTTR